MSTIADKLKKIRADISDTCVRAGRSEKSVKVVVVTKTAGIEAIQEVIRQGFVDLGENRVQHLKQVAEEVDTFLQENQDSLQLCFQQQQYQHLLYKLQELVHLS